LPCPRSTSSASPIPSRSAVDQANKEIGTRFDFKGSDSRVELKDFELTLHADDDFKLGQVRDVLLAKLAKRQVDVRFLDLGGKPEKIGGDKLKLLVKVRNGIEQTLAKRIVQTVKDAKALKLTAGIQGDVVRVQGAKRDALQGAIALLRAEVKDVPLGFENFRD
jgi:uncharacterized protein YajQ (UPF0234 family)